MTVETLPPTTRIFTFGYGQECPFTGKSLADHYVTVIAPDRSSARRLMFAAFGRDWAFEYGPNDRQFTNYAHRMTEHARLVIDPPAADPTGLTYTRADSEDEDPRPVSPARAPWHTGSVVSGDRLVIDGQ